MERSLRWLLEVPSEKSGMSELGSSCRERTEEVMWYASQGQGRVTSCFPAWTMVRDNTEGGAGCTEVQVPMCHPSGLVQCVRYAVDDLDHRLRSDWLETESWGRTYLSFTFPWNGSHGK